MILKAIKKPVTIECIEWTGDNLFEVITFTDGKPDLSCAKASDAWTHYKDHVDSEGLKIHTLEGLMNANVGDFIIKGVNGEFYPCKPDIFHKTYDIK